jgi:hypothetical protein
MPTLWSGDGGATADPVFSGQALRRPEGYDRWPLVGASLGLSYAEMPSGTTPSEFHRVYMNPEAYDAFRKTGAFPEGTTFVLELYEAQQKVAPARSGFFEGRRTALEASVKDSRRFRGRWAYFGFQNGALEYAKPNPPERCHACHAAHAAKDNVFVQFYPNLR